MLSCVIPAVYEMFCVDYSIDSDIGNIKISDKLNFELKLLGEQYAKRSTENFSIRP